jgi:hypothetical protein
MSNKTNKTSKKNSFVIEWPTSHFTIEDIQGKYPDAVNITLRFRVKQAVENKDVMVIGKIKPAIGRPKLVFSRANPSKELLEAAKAAGVIAASDTLTTVSVTEVTTDKKNKSVVPVTANASATTNTVAASAS